MEKLKNIFSVVLSVSLALSTMTGITIQADAAADECMVADFGNATTVDAVADSMACMSKSTEITYNGANSSLKVTGDSNNGFYVCRKDGGKFVGLAPEEKDVSGYKYFRMRIYSKNSGDAFRVSISTTGVVDGSSDNEFRYTLKTRGTGWQEVALPLSAATAGVNANWRNIAGVYLKSNSEIGSTPAGHEIYIDKIWFGNTAGEAINADKGLVVADFSDAAVATDKQAQAINYLTVEDNLTVLPGKTSLKWTPTKDNQLPTMAVNPIDVSEYKNVRIRFYSTDADKKFVLLATYKAETGISKNPYFYTVITSDGTGWQDVSIPETDFVNTGVRDIDDNGNKAAPSWDHIGGIFLQAGGWGTESSSIAGKAVYIDSIMFDGFKYLRSDKLYINRETCVINGFADMTLSEVRSCLDLPDGETLTFYDAEDKKIEDESTAAVKGIKAKLTNDEEYELSVPLYEFKNARFNDSTIKTFSQGTLKVDLDAVCYRQGTTVDANLIVAQFDNDNRFIGAAYTPGTIKSSDEGTTLSVSYDVEKAENTKIRVFVLESFGTMKPLTDNAIELTPSN